MTDELAKPAAKVPQFTPKQQMVIDILGDPDDGRNQSEIARDLKMRPETLSRMKRIPGFMDAVNEMLDRNKRHARPSVWKQMVRHAKGRSSADRRLYLQAVGDIKEKADVSNTVAVKIDWGSETPWDEEEQEKLSA
jgi:hypothetical protein